MKLGMGLAIAFLTVAIGTSTAAAAGNVVNAGELPSAKRTASGQYMTSENAFMAISKSPSILFVDVRDPVEITQSGKPVGIDAVVPVKVQGFDYDVNLQEFVLENNPDFVAEMEALVARYGKDKNSQIILTCGSGYRSAIAARKLESAGFTNVWHITDGYEGDEKPGLNLENAWKLAGLPWNSNQNGMSLPWRKVFE